MLDTLYTSNTYNGYSDIASMDTTMVMLGATMDTAFWSEIDDPAKEALILASVRHINSIDWKGTQNEDIVVKTMLFPREGLDNIADDEVPEEITLLMGCWITHNAVANGNGTGNVSAGMVISKSVGDVDLTYESKADIIKALGSDVNSNPCSSYASMYMATETIGGIGGVGLKRRP